MKHDKRARTSIDNLKNSKDREEQEEYNHIHSAEMFEKRTEKYQTDKEILNQLTSEETKLIIRTLYFLIEKKSKRV